MLLVRKHGHKATACRKKAAGEPKATKTGDSKPKGSNTKGKERLTQRGVAIIADSKAIKKMFAG